MVRHLYHGTSGDNILEIIRQHALRPNEAGKLYFSEFRFDSVLMHGGDMRRKATFAIKVMVTIPPEVVLQRTATQGVSDTLVITTGEPLKVQVVELFVRRPRAATTEVIKGEANIIKYLTT
jgi:hypothetical protein